MRKVLIVCINLKIGGGEKLVHEIVTFSVARNIVPTILVPDAYNVEYYDEVYRNLGVKVVRVNIKNWYKLRDPLKIVNSLFWKFKLRFFSTRLYNSVHIINLTLAERYYHDIPHPHRYFWDVVNAVQYNGSYSYTTRLFSQTSDTLVFINQYQELELRRQFPDISTPAVHFKLFLNDTA